MKNQIERNNFESFCFCDSNCFNKGKGFFFLYIYKKQMCREYWTLETSWHPYYPWSLILIWTQPDIYFRKAQNTQTSEQLCVLSFSTTNGQETKPVRSWLEVNCSTSAPKWQIGFLMLPGWIFWPDFLVYTNTIQVTVHSMNLVVISNFF